MSMISELVKELRWIADYEYQSRNSEDTIRRAADTIEMLSKKVREPKHKEGEWVTKAVKKLCAPDCWYPGIFAIEGSWNEKEGSWLEEQDGFCSECEKQDEHYYGHKYCPNCGAKMKGADE